jgi:anhydro-N-acetylmuramic acid kinase
LSYYIGLLSGTSVDGIDAAIVDINARQLTLTETHSQAFSLQLKTDLQQLIKNQNISLKQLAAIDSLLAFEFSQAVELLISKAKIDKKDIIAIGSHGQTIFHQPNGNHRNTIQIGSAHMIAANLNIKVVSHFRNMDMACGGQGAPLAPILHQLLFSQTNRNTAVINLGGISNVSFVGKDYQQAIGFDTGPANCLIDEWMMIHKQQAYDENGQWAQSGQLNSELLAQMLKDDYFFKPSPKSTGREYFNHRWYDNFRDLFKSLTATDIQTTLSHLTAATIALAIEQQTNIIDNIMLMGGGCKNSFLTSLIKQYCKIPVSDSTQYQYDPDWIEAMLFAYLAQQRINNQRINLNSITGSSKAILIGDIIVP